MCIDQYNQDLQALLDVEYTYPRKPRNPNNNAYEHMCEVAQRYQTALDILATR